MITRRDILKLFTVAPVAASVRPEPPAEPEKIEVRSIRVEVEYWNLENDSQRWISYNFDIIQMNETRDAYTNGTDVMIMGRPHRIFGYKLIP